MTDPVAAYYVGDILRGAPPPANALKGRIAFKTGTSYGFRDALAIGFDRRTTIAVWVGRPDNGPTPGLIGREAAAPILFDAFERLGRSIEPIPPPKGVLRATVTADLPPPLRRLRQDAPKTIAAPEAASLKIAFPPDGARIDLGLKEGARGSSARSEGAWRRAAVHLVRQWRAGRRSRDQAPIGLEAGRRRLRARVRHRRQGRVGRGDGAGGVMATPPSPPARPRAARVSAATKASGWSIITWCSASGIST